MSAIRHRYVCEVSLADTDAGGRVHFPRVMEFAERAEHNFLRGRGLVVLDREEGGWPRARVVCDYLLPLFFGEVLEVFIGVTALGRTSVTWGFEVVKETGEVAARGEVVTVRVDIFGKPVPLSEEERGALEGLK